MDPLAPTALPLSAPRTVPDLRPVADAAALPRAPRPPASDMPLIVGNSREIVAIGKALLDHPGEDRIDATDAVPRVLKPFGIPMFPDFLPSGGASGRTAPPGA